MRALASIAILSTVSFLATACGPTCQTTCERMYDETQCGSQITAGAGASVGSLISDCSDICEDALKVTGPPVEADDPRYDPTKRTTIPTEETRILDDENEAAAWMDCVWSFDDTTCTEQLGEQYCVWVY